YRGRHENLTKELRQEIDLLDKNECIGVVFETAIIPAKATAVYSQLADHGPDLKDHSAGRRHALSEMREFPPESGIQASAVVDSLRAFAPDKLRGLWLPAPPVSNSRLTL